MTSTRQPGRPARSSAQRNGQVGFSLLELMLVVGLVAILTAIAVPSYRAYQDRARVAQATRDIGEISQRIERFRTAQLQLPMDLDEVGRDGVLDPWGRPYVYYNVESNGLGGARKDRRLNPLNTDFDLYSLGKNGRTKPQISQKDSVDDVIRASNGRFVGKAEDY